MSTKLPLKATTVSEKEEQEPIQTANSIPEAKARECEQILNVFCQHGASTSILADAHPHIGTDKLPRVIENMRNTIIECGGEVHFETRMDSLIIEKTKSQV